MKAMYERPMAFFVECPFRLEDLTRPHGVDQCRPYVIAKTVNLAGIDYENFITDLSVDRWFIEENAPLCSIDSNGVWHCILVKRRHQSDGVLVMPDGENFPLWAAYVREVG